MKPIIAQEEEQDDDEVQNTTVTTLRCPELSLGRVEMVSYIEGFNAFCGYKLRDRGVGVVT